MCQFQSFTHTKSHLVQFSQSIPFRNLTKLSYECLHILTNIFFFSIYIDMENIRIRIKISTLEICNVPRKKKTN